jgi:hypothetical protein
MRFSPLLAVGLFALGAGGCSSSSALPPPTFRAAEGWVILGSGPASVVAVTADDAEALSPFAPFDFAALGPDGIVVWATTMGRGEHGPTADFPRARWPLRLANFRVDCGWEMQPAPDIQQRLEWAVVGDWHLEVRVYFGTQEPTEALLAKAQAQLERLVLPSRRSSAEILVRLHVEPHGEEQEL